MKNWKYGIFDDAVDKGSSNISLNKIQEDNGEYPVFGAKGFMKNVSFFQQEKEYLGVIKDGAGIGRVSKHPAKSSILATMQYIIPKEEYNIDFIRYFLEGLDFESYRTGSTIPHIYYKDYKKAKFPLVGDSEQKQIVAILDQTFTAIDQAKANIEKNIVNAKELFQSKLNDIFSQKGDGWEEKSLGEVCYVLNGYAFKSKDVIEESNTQLLRMGNLYKNILNLDRKPVFYPDSFNKNHKDYLLKEGDLIMSLTGTVDKTDYGYTVKIPKIDVDLLLNQRIMKIEVHDSNILNKDYLKNYLLSPDFLSRLYDTASGTRQANLSSRTILTLKVNYPQQIDKQLQVVNQFNQLRKHIFKLENQYSKKLKNLEDLKKAILQKAFAGELTEKEVVA